MKIINTEREKSRKVMEEAETFIGEGDFESLDSMIKGYITNDSSDRTKAALLRSTYRVRNRLPHWRILLTEGGINASYLIGLK